MKTESQVKAHLGSAHKIIVFEPNASGGRLKYYGTDANAGFWDGIWSSTTSIDYARELRGHLPYALRKALMKRVKSGGRVLEAGCGVAKFTVAMDALGFDAEGIDYAPKVIGMLNARFPEIEFRQADATNLHDVDDAIYDAVYSPGVCEHFEEGPECILRESYRILAPGGTLVVSSPCFNGFRQGLARANVFSSTVPKELPFYQYAFSRRELTEILEKIGFRVENTIGKGSFLTLEEHVPGVSRFPEGRIKKIISAGMDRTYLRQLLGHSCLWIARKPDDA